MKADDELEVVSFITAEEADDLIVSFAIMIEEPGEVVSLTLLRTPAAASTITFSFGRKANGDS